MAPDSSTTSPSQSAPTEYCWLKGPIRRKTSPPIGQGMRFYEPHGAGPSVLGVYMNGDAAFTCAEESANACTDAACDFGRDANPPRAHYHEARAFSPELVRDEAIRSLCAHLGVEPPAGLTPRLSAPCND